MNIFKNFENLVAFPLVDAITDFQQLAKEISYELGEHKFLLNKYLSEVFEISSHIDIKLAVESADKICSEILSDCYRIFCSNFEKEKGRYSYLVEKDINENPIDINDSHTKAEYYATEILMEHLEIFADDFIEMLKAKFNYINFSKLNHYYKEMAKIVSKERIEYLNDLMCEAFFMCPTGVAFMGQISAKCVEMLVYRDSDTSKQIFEIMLEETCNE